MGNLLVRFPSSFLFCPPSLSLLRFFCSSARHTDSLNAVNLDVCVRSEIDHFTLPQDPFLGFTAATGDVSDNHEIVSVETHSIVHKPLSKGGTGRGRQLPGAYGSAGKTGDRGGTGGPGILRRTFGAIVGFVWFLIKVALVLGVIGGVVLYFYKHKRVHNAKRF